MKRIFYSNIMAVFIYLFSSNIVFSNSFQLIKYKINALEDSALNNNDSIEIKQLNLKDAIKLALTNNPEIELNFMEIKTKEAMVLQQSLFPNPAIGFELENFAGSGSYNTFKSSEATFGISQLIELGGKREKRVQAAKIISKLSEWDYESKKIEVITQVKKAFTSVLFAQQQVELYKELLKLSEDFKIVISQRVEAGVLSPAELSRANVEVTKAQIKLESSRRLLQINKNRLSALWGNDIAKFDKAIGDLNLEENLPSYKEFKDLLVQNPLLARISDQKEFQLVNLNLQKAQNIPDPVVTAGYRRLIETSNGAVVAGVAIPLPVLNKNQGNIQKADIQLNKVDIQKQYVEILLQKKLNAYYEMLQSTLYEEVNLKEKIIPESENTYEIINRGYLVGKFTFLDVLSAQKTMFEAKENYLNALRNYQIILSEIEGLTGQNRTK